jgi:hypothetical protein
MIKQYQWLLSAKEASAREADTTLPRNQKLCAKRNVSTLLPKRWQPHVHLEGVVPLAILANICLGTRFECYPLDVEHRAQFVSCGCEISRKNRSVGMITLLRVQWWRDCWIGLDSVSLDMLGPKFADERGEAALSAEACETSTFKYFLRQRLASISLNLACPSHEELLLLMVTPRYRKYTLHPTTNNSLR